MARFDILGPVFWYESITSARRARYFLIRGLYAAILLFVLYSNYSVFAAYSRYTAATSANLAATFFETFAYVQMCAVLVVTPATVAAAIAQERERRTIEYLFASQLSNSEIVLGKLGAKLAQIAFLLLTGLPILATAMLMGGIAPDSLLLVFAGTFSSLAMVCGLSILVSVSSARTRDAVLRAYLLLVALIVVPMLLELIWFAFFLPRFAVGGAGSGLLFDVLRAVHWLNPFTWLRALLAFDWGMPGASPWELAAPPIAAQTIFGLVLTGWAALRVRSTHLRQAGRAAASGRGRRRRGLRPLRGEPMIWKELYAERGLKLGLLGRLALWVPLALVAIMFIMSVISFSRFTGERGVNVDLVVGFLVTFGTITACLAFIAVLVRASLSITAEKERDCWLGLISTPLTGAEIVRGKFWGAVHSGRWMGMLAGSAFLFSLVLKPVMALAFVMTCFVAAAVAGFTAALGTFVSLRSKSSLRSILTSLAIVIFVSGGYWFCCFPVLIVGRGGDGLVMWLAAPVIPFLVAAPSVSVLSEMRSTESVQAIVVTIVGAIGYAIAAMALHSSSKSEFDRIAERKPRALRSRRPAPQLEPAPSDDEKENPD